ncbi:unnamed protein product [Soboliphyme baturini]|uniref:Secreted protein n=1 Tax=Soboliphyme baturini TaxID=241478 RepID=A0A183IEK0_9BILA|nr:unnamed protein product [Soboliphyme baturini]
MICGTLATHLGDTCGTSATATPARMLQMHLWRFWRPATENNSGVREAESAYKLRGFSHGFETSTSKGYLQQGQRQRAL